MPGTSRYFKSLIQRQTERVKHEQEIARIANRYNELKRDDQNALNAFVQKSTMEEVDDFGYDNNIVTMAYSPLAKGRALEDGKVMKIAEKYNKHRHRSY